jgi:hypothetical protein
VPVGHYDDLSLPAYFAAKEAEWMSKVPPGFLQTVEEDPVITSRVESSGPLLLFAEFLDRSIGEAMYVFLQIDKRECIDDTVYDEIDYDVRFCMFDLVPPAAPLPGIDTGEVVERLEIMDPDAEPRSEGEGPRPQVPAPKSPRNFGNKLSPRGPLVTQAEVEKVLFNLRKYGDLKNAKAYLNSLPALQRRNAVTMLRGRGGHYKTHRRRKLPKLL